jgi:large subunit ribosomal protein L20
VPTAERRRQPPVERGTNLSASTRSVAVGPLGGRHDDRAPHAPHGAGTRFTMARVKRGAKRAQKRKKILKLAKGYYGTKSKAHRMAKQAVDKSLAYSYRDRRQKKRQFRSLWIVRINAAARLHGLSYNRLIAGLKASGSELDRKMLADIAVRDAQGFADLAALAKRGLEGQAPQPAPQA